MNYKKTNDILKTILIIFLIIQPIFDLKMFYNSISTLIRTIIIATLFIIIFILDNNKKKYWLFLFFGLVGIYFIFHHINAILNFHSVVPDNFNYSVIKELTYFIKMLSPFLLIYTFQTLKIEPNKIKIIIYSICLLVSSIIIVSNLFLFSYSSYNNMLIKDNFLSWFIDHGTNHSYDELLSKGLFEFANQITALLLMFLPFCIYYAIQEKTLKDILILSLTILALLLIGTRTAIFGIPIVFLYVFSILLLFQFMNKTKYFNKKNINILVTVLCFYLIIILVHPIFNRYQMHKNIIETSSDISVSNIEYNSSHDSDSISANNNTTTTYSHTNNITNNNTLTDYILENYKTFRIHDQFILDSYPYQYDPEFWYDILQKPIELRVNYRYLETAMVKRVVEINNNKLDIVLGITNTRLQNIFNIEKDFVVQYYALGIIGLLLLIFPYIGLLFYYLYSVFKHKEQYFNPLNIISFITIAFLLCISYYSGNLLNSLSFTIYFSILFHLLFSKTEYNKETC